MLNKKDLHELIAITRQHINLREAVIEKDLCHSNDSHSL